MTSTNKPKVPIEEQKYSKHRVPRVTTNLESATFSDIVNYESNDDLISLTGDRKLKKNIGYPGAHYTNHVNVVNGIPKAPKVEDSTSTLKKTNESKYQIKPESSFPLNRLHSNIKRESDMVKIDESYNVSSKFSDHSQALMAQKQYKIEEQRVQTNTNSNQETEKSKSNISSFKDDLYIENKVREPSIKSEHSNTALETKQDFNLNNVLNRISEEAMAQSGETLMSKSFRSANKEPKNAKHQSPISDLKSNKKSDQFMTFRGNNNNDKSQKNSSPNDSKMNSNRNISQTSRSKRSKYDEEQEIMKEVKRREKVKQKQQYEQKLKELQRLEQILQQKEKNKQKKKWAVKVIQKWVKGHI